MNCFPQLAFVALAFLLTACQPRTASNTELPPPNILWIVSEDNSADYLRLYDPEGASMPTIEALARQGVTYRNAFSNAPVCSVARSTLITGCYAPRIGAQYHRANQQVPLPAGLEMFPAYLRRQGYYTSNNAKEDYNLPKSEEVWDESGREASYEKRSPGQPFFHVQNFGITHESRLHFPASDLKEDPLPTDALEVAPYFPDTDVFRYTHARYLRQHERLDTQINAFLQPLRETGLLDSTIIFYYGDHGGVLPRSKGYLFESGLRVPLVVYVPEAYQQLAPHPAGSWAEEYVVFADFGPTVLSLAGVPVPEAMDGIPFLGAAAGAKSEEKSQAQQVFGYADRFDEKYDLVRSLRQGKLKYIRNYQGYHSNSLQNNYRYLQRAYAEWRELYQQGKLNPVQAAFFQPRPPEQLYNLEVDPHETKNLAQDPAYQEQVRTLRQALRDQVKSLPDLSFIPEPIFLAEGLENPVAYGQQNKARIATLVDVVDLSLQPYSEVKESIKTSLSSEDPMERHWALVAATHFGAEAQELTETVSRLADSDPAFLVRVRAVDFLARCASQAVNGHLGQLLEDAATEDEPSASVLLNVVVSLQEAGLASDYQPKLEVLPTAWVDAKRTNVAWRAKFLREEL
ncbi:MAG: sulfatase [Bacteroidota bacterium]